LPEKNKADEIFAPKQKIAPYGAIFYVFIIKVTPLQQKSQKSVNLFAYMNKK